jgi:hypothetical protein
MFNDGWPDNFGPAWCIWQQLAAQEEVKERKLRARLGLDPNADTQFDYAREADQGGYNIREVDNAQYRQSSTGSTRGGGSD